MGLRCSGYGAISGFGPFTYEWDGNDLPYPPATLSLDSLFDMTDEEGNLIPTHHICCAGPMSNLA